MEKGFCLGLSSDAVYPWMIVANDMGLMWQCSSLYLGYVYMCVCVSLLNNMGQVLQSSFLCLWRMTCDICGSPLLWVCLCYHLFIYLIFVEWEKDFKGKPSFHAHKWKASSQHHLLRAWQRATDMSLVFTLRFYSLFIFLLLLGVSGCSWWTHTQIIMLDIPVKVSLIFF